MSMSFGRNSSQSRQDATSESSGYSSATSVDQSTSTSDSLSGGQSTSGQSIAFEDIYKQLYGGATGAAGNALLNSGDLTAAAKQLFTGGQGFLDSLGQDAGSTYMNDRLNNDDVLNEQLGLLREDTGKLFNEDLNPAITSRSVAGGTLGGGRQGVAQGMALDAVGTSYAKGAAALRSSDQSQKDAIASQVAGNTLTAAQTGLGALPGLLDLVQSGNNADLGIYQSLSTILGGPTTLGSSQATNFSQTTAQSIAQALSQSYGQQNAASNSVGRSSSHGWNTSAAFELV